MTIAEKLGTRWCTRYGIIGTLFVVTCINYADRASISIAGTAIKTEFGISPVTLGFIFSAFGWAYVIGQIPGGALLDRYGSRVIYISASVAWSLCTLAQGFATWLTANAAVITFLGLRFLLGLTESPSFPANARIVANWFPSKERGTATAIFNSAQYGALVIFAPLMAWVTESFGWHTMFFTIGALSLLGTLLFIGTVFPPSQHPRLSRAELDYITANGALTNLDNKARSADRTPLSWSIIRQLLTSRTLMGLYIGQYCITALTYFFATWFPVYLIEEHGMTITQAGFGAALPAACGFVGGVIGGIFSDALLKRGHSVTFSRKTPFVLGMLLSLAIALCNFTTDQTIVLAFMAVAFFGKGLAALGWAVLSDAAPTEVTGLSGGIFNAVGNIAGIITPITIGYTVQATGSFELALYFVAAHSLLAMLSYLVIVGPIRRLVLKEQPAN